MLVKFMRGREVLEEVWRSRLEKREGGRRKRKDVG